MRRSIASAVVIAIATACATGTKLIGGSAPVAGGTAEHAGAESVFGGHGNDLLFGLSRHPQKPRPLAQPAAAPAEARRTLVCGKGRDIVNTDHRDRIGVACEVVSRRVSRDTFAEAEAQHETEVEPDSFAVGSTMVVTFQIGRFRNGGSLAIGFATTRDAGATWQPGVLPSLSSYSRPVGPYEVVSDPSVAYDAVHKNWLITSLAAVERGTVLLVSRSRDGVGWSAPAVAARPGGDYDKQWIACDNWARSPFRGRCYLSYVNFSTGALETRRSIDGGRTWSSPSFSVTRLPSSSNLNGAQPVAMPDGALVVFYTAFNGFLVGLNEIGVVRSVDGGVTFTRAPHVSNLMSLDIDGVRAAPFVSAAQDATGVTYVAWSDCRYQDDCNTSGIVYSRSRDGVNWSTPARVPTGDPRSEVDHFLPGLAVMGSGKTTRIAVAYYARPQPLGCGYNCLPAVNVWLSESRNAGATWLKPQKLNRETMRGQWIADSDFGKFLGDYISTSYVRGKPMPVFSLALRPIGGRLRQSTYVTTRLVR